MTKLEKAAAQREEIKEQLEWWESRTPDDERGEREQERNLERLENKLDDLEGRIEELVEEECEKLREKYLG